MKNIKDVCFIIPARTQSTRVPNKMLKPFVDSSLLEIAINKVLASKKISKYKKIIPLLALPKLYW